MISTEQRRARLGIRHHLAVPAESVERVAADLAGIHSSDPATVYLAAWARVKDFRVEDLERALYKDRSLVRMLGMRRTMFVVTRDGAATMNAAYTRALIEGQRKRQIKILEDSGITDDGADFTDRVADATMQALEARRRPSSRRTAPSSP